MRTRLAARQGGRVAVGVQRTGLAGAAAVGSLEGAGSAGGAGTAVGPSEARVAEAIDEAPALGEGEGVIGRDDSWFNRFQKPRHTQVCLC